jgi:hypothetical protein
MTKVFCWTSVLPLFQIEEKMERSAKRRDLSQAEKDIMNKKTNLANEEKDALTMIQ